MNALTAELSTCMNEGRDPLPEVLPRPAAGPEDAEAPAIPPSPGVADGFDAFLQQQYPVLVQFLRNRSASEQDAQDAAQESLSRLLRYRDSEPPSAWRPLLFRIATNVAHDQLRRVQVQRQHTQAPLEDDDPALLAASRQGEPTPEQRMADRQQLALVLTAIRYLPDKCRNVFLLSRFHGMTNQAIAARCGISVRMVEKQITKALAACRGRVRDYGA